jgi:hypothetical protein
MGRADEALSDGVVEEGEEGVVEAFDVEKAVGFAVKAELGPGEDFGKFLEGAEAAGQGDEGIGKVGHEGLAFMHGGDDPKVFKAKMGDFLRNEGLRDDAGDFAAGGHYGVGDGAHQPDTAAAEDEADTAFGEQGAQIAGGRGVTGAGTGIGAAIDADTFEVHTEKCDISGAAGSMTGRHPALAKKDEDEGGWPLAIVIF